MRFEVIQNAFLLDSYGRDGANGSDGGTGGIGGRRGLGGNAGVAIFDCGPSGGDGGDGGDGGNGGHVRGDGGGLSFCIYASNGSQVNSQNITYYTGNGGQASLSF